MSEAVHRILVKETGLHGSFPVKQKVSSQGDFKSLGKSLVFFLPIASPVISACC
jgi:hypothetical protein